MTTVHITHLIESYDVLLFDAYGVLVRSDGAIDGAPELIAHLNTIKKPYFVLTNDASRQIRTSAAHYRSCGLDVQDERVITSGSLIHSFVRTHTLQDKPVKALGTQDALKYVVDSGARLLDVDDAEAIDALFLCELSSQLHHDMEAILSGLIAQIDRGHTPHLVLPNPDLIYPKSATTFGITAGSIAAMFETILNQRYPERTYSFQKLGKPHYTIYQEGLNKAGAHKSRAVMIGDQLATDVRGALDFGISAALVNTGLSTHDQLEAHPDCVPTYLLDGLWP